MATMAFRFFIFLLLGRSAAELQAHFVGPDTGYPLARCLDGTPALYYLSPGYDSGKDKYFIFHQGGGFCDSDGDCLERAGTYLGSTSSDDPANNNVCQVCPGERHVERCGPEPVDAQLEPHLCTIL